MRIVHSSAEEAHAYQVAERVVLSCELSRPDVPVCWYKDGEEVEESENLSLESEGPHCRLVIPSAQVQDSGEFVCDAGGDSAFFNVIVTGKRIDLAILNFPLPLYINRAMLREVSFLNYNSQNPPAVLPAVGFEEL